MAAKVALGEIFAIILVLLLVSVLYSVYLSLPDVLPHRSFEPAVPQATVSVLEPGLTCRSLGEMNG
ncbi:hypothetical protein UC8_53560 [Roseimaritima ulvae]|uniref:Uncharacterized protein n=2 Tax=Roseimaritima ulvae TaxID=980254 RepID=A0A5B9QZA8_9BACT|nr:hypothetical protein UC8_53560 [Roseimaritima ulvae]